jgi:hypothetical protein
MDFRGLLLVRGNHPRLHPVGKRLTGRSHKGSSQVKVLIGIGIIILAVIVAAAVIPEKDCAGNSTWKKAEVCHTGK